MKEDEAWVLRSSTGEILWETISEDKKKEAFGLVDEAKAAERGFTFERVVVIPDGCSYEIYSTRPGVDAG